jgi:hypothetical protein
VYPELYPAAERGPAKEATQEAQRGQSQEAWFGWFVQWYEGENQRRRSLGTDSLQVAKEKLWRFESGLYRGEDCPLPTRTPVGEVVAAYIDHMRADRPERSWKRDLSYLRESFGECRATGPRSLAAIRRTAQSDLWAIRRVVVP